MMLLSFTLEELKMLKDAVRNRTFGFTLKGIPICKDREKYEALEEKLNKEIEYYDTSEQKD